LSVVHATTSANARDQFTIKGSHHARVGYCRVSVTAR
jgi:hypothetical protein